MNIEDLGSREPHDEPTETPPLIAAIRIAGPITDSRAMAIEVRERALGAIAEMIDPIDIDYPLGITEEEIAAHVAAVARFVTGLADAVAAYVVTGSVESIPAPTGDESDAGTIDGE